MANELPPQFIDEDGGKFCPSCSSSTSDACVLKGLIYGLQDSEVTHHESFKPETLAMDIAVHGPATAIEKRRKVEAATDQVAQILGGNCLRYAEAELDSESDS